MSDALVIDAVVKRYGGAVAVDGLSLVARRGEILGLLGPNGAGKTTTVALATGALVPDSGRVEIVGRGAPTSRAARRLLGVAPQALAVYEALSGRENLEFVASLFGLGGALRRTRVEQALAFSGLGDRADDRVATYSGGMKRRLNLAAAIVHEPEILLLDEPTVGVDPQSRQRLLDGVRSLRARGRTIVYATHYMEEAERLCDRVAIVDHGRLLALDTVPALLATHGGLPLLVADTAAGETRLLTADPLAELNRLAVQGAVGSFRVERPRLEDVFLHLTGRTLRD